MRLLRFGSMVTIVLAASSLPAKSAAQTADSLAGLGRALARTKPFSQVMIELRGGQRLTGAFHPRPDSLELGGPSGASTVVAFGDVDSLWRKHRATGHGAMVGAGLGILPGALLGLLLAAGACSEAACDHGEVTQVAVGGAVLLGVVGAGVGALIGSAFPRWSLAWHRQHSRADRSRPPALWVPIEGARDSGGAAPQRRAPETGNLTAMAFGGRQAYGGRAGLGIGGSLGLQLHHGSLGLGPEVSVATESGGTVTAFTLLGRLDLHHPPSSSGKVPYLIFGAGWVHSSWATDEITSTLGLGYTAHGRTRVEVRWSPMVQGAGSSLLTVGVGRVLTW